MHVPITFSIVIPTHDRVEQLGTCLESLASLNYPKDQFEVVVVDDGSVQSLYDTITPFDDKLNFKFIQQGQAGPAAARNRGVSHASNSYIAFTDDDCQPEPNWLSHFADGFRKNPEAILGGYTINALEDNSQAVASQLLIDHIYQYFNREPNDARFFTSNNLAVSRDRFLESGGFDTQFPLAAGEDREICDRWRHQGRQLIYIPSAIILHSHEMNLKRFCKQHFNYGQGAFQFHRRRSLRNSSRHRLEPFRFYRNMFQLAFTKNQDAFKMTSLLLISQLANAAGFFYAKLLRRLPKT